MLRCRRSAKRATKAVFHFGFWGDFPKIFCWQRWSGHRCAPKSRVASCVWIRTDRPVDGPPSGWPISGLLLYMCPIVRRTDAVKNPQWPICLSSRVDYRLINNRRAFFRSFEYLVTLLFTYSGALITLSERVWERQIWWVGPKLLSRKALYEFHPKFMGLHLFAMVHPASFVLELRIKIERE